MVSRRVLGLFGATFGAQIAIIYYFVCTGQRKQLARIIFLGGEGYIHSELSIAGQTNQECIRFENFVPEEMFVKLRDTKKYSQTSRASFLAGFRLVSSVLISQLFTGWLRFWHSVKTIMNCHKAESIV